MKFKITERPTYASGSLQGEFTLGEVVEVPSTMTDSDGDVRAFKVVDGKVVGSGFWLRFACLTPASGFEPGTVVQISAVRAALIALGIEADVVAVAQAIEAAVTA